GPLVDRWTPAVEAVRNVTTSFDDRIRFGLMLFGSDAVCAPGEMQVAPVLGASASIMDALAGDPASVTGGGTPTAASLDVAAGAQSGLEDASYILLVTDGAPNGNSASNGYTCRCTAGPCSANNLNCLDDTNAVSAVRRLDDAGIHTFVVGYGTTEWADVLDRMADAGGTGNDRHFPVNDGASLEAAFDQI